VDVTAAAGLRYRQAAAHRPGGDDWYAMNGLDADAAYMTGGAAAADFDGDGLVDLYVTRLDKYGLLFRNLGDGTFEDVTMDAGLAAVGMVSVGALFADVDNDGDPDLYVTTLGSSRHWLFINDGGAFTDEALARGAAVESAAVHQGYSVSAGDYDRDGWLDLHTTEWTFDLSSPAMPSHARLLRGLGAGGGALAGHFEDSTDIAGVALWHTDTERAGDFSFSSIFSDLDDDGWPDLYVASDFGTSQLFWNDGDGTFSDGTAAAGVGTADNAMGLTAGDYDGDGDLDVFVTSIACDEVVASTLQCSGNRLYRNEGGRSFSDQTDAVGVRDGRWGWGTTFFDYDNDGDLDLVMTNGVSFAGSAFDPFRADVMRLWRNDGSGGMQQWTTNAGLFDTSDGKGLLTLDYDADGDLDLFIISHVTGGRLYRNDWGNAQDYLRVRLVGTRSNRDGIGARVRVTVRQGDTPQLRELRGGSNFLAHDERVLHFGLGEGDAPVAEVRVLWPTPGGRVEQVLTDVARNQVLTITEPQ
jgi:hypothetical protein